MVVILYENGNNLVNSELEYAKIIEDIESLYHSFEELKLMLGQDDVVLLEINLIKIFQYFPFDAWYLTGAPIGVSPATYLDTTKVRTITWTDFVNLEKYRSDSKKDDDDEIED